MYDYGYERHDTGWTNIISGVFIMNSFLEEVFEGQKSSAILRAEDLVVLLYQGFSKEELRWLITDCEMKAKVFPLLG